MPKYNHLFAIAFGVDSDHESDGVTAAELREALDKRIRELRSDDEVLEACSDCGDTIEREEVECV
jgi:hypothetical protein